MFCKQEDDLYKILSFVKYFFNQKFRVLHFFVNGKNLKVRKKLKFCQKPLQVIVYTLFAQQGM